MDKGNDYAMKQQEYQNQVDAAVEIAQGLQAALERTQAQNAALMAVLEAASDAEWPYYSNREGDRYCVECDRLIASGPHSPNPHADDCRWGELWGAIRQARATLEAQS